MKKKLLVLLAMVLSIPAFLGLSASPASAWVVQNTDWIQGRSMYNWYDQAQGYPQYYGTSGVWLYSRTQHKFFLWTPGHFYQDGYYNVNFGSPARPFVSVYEKSINNRYDGAPATVLHPGNGYEKYDMKLVDFGANAIAADPRVWNYCSPFPDCGSNTGGSTTNANWDGYAMTVKGSIVTWQGQSLCKSGARTGTSCGNVWVGYFSNKEYGNYEQWVWYLDNIGNCGGDSGDSGSPVYYFDGTNVYTAGMAVSAYQESHADWSSCGISSDGVHNKNLQFIPVSTARDAWPSLDLVVLAG